MTQLYNVKQLKLKSNNNNKKTWLFQLLNQIK